MVLRSLIIIITDVHFLMIGITIIIMIIRVLNISAQGLLVLFLQLAFSKLIIKLPILLLLLCIHLREQIQQEILEKSLHAVHGFRQKPKTMKNSR